MHILSIKDWLACKPEDRKSLLKKSKIGTDLKTTAALLEDVIYDNLAVIGSHIKTMKGIDTEMYAAFCKDQPELEVFWHKCEREYDERFSKNIY